MAKRPQHKKPQNQKGYSSNDFKDYENKHLMAFVMRNDKTFIDVNGIKHFPVPIMIILNGFDNVDFINKVSDFNHKGKDYHVIDKKDLTDNSSKPSKVLKLKATPSPGVETKIQFDLLLNNEDWNGCERLSVVIPLENSNNLQQENSESVVSSTTKLKEKDVERFILTVECDIIIPPFP